MTKELIARARLRAGYNPRKPEDIRRFGNVDEKLHCELADELARLTADCARKDRVLRTLLAHLDDVGAEGTAIEAARAEVGGKEKT